jgi:RNA polymerase sigma-70 factor (ECF subfamily)
MLQAVRDIERYDARRPFAPWLHRIVVNRSLDLLRRRDRRPESALGEPELDSLAVQADERWAGPAVAALAQLEPDDRAAVVLRHVFGYSAREIGRMLDMPHATVRTRLRRSLMRVRAVLELQGGDAQ